MPKISCKQVEHNSSHDIDENDLSALKTNKLAELYAEVIKMIGEDPTRPGLENTATRAAKAMNFLTSGYRNDAKSIVANALYPCVNSEMVIVKDIQLFSICEHHLLPFVGKCHVGYIPNGNVVGLSKIARLVDVYARRLQIQEHLTNQIAESLMLTTQAQGVIVQIEAMHLCMMMRGVLKHSASTHTLATTGILQKNQNLRQEFIQAVQLGNLEKIEKTFI